VALHIKRVLMTGTHTVAQLFCIVCTDRVGRVSLISPASNPSQRYKEGKSLLENMKIRRPVDTSEMTPAALESQIQLLRRASLSTHVFGAYLAMSRNMLHSVQKRRKGLRRVDMFFNNDSTCIEELFGCVVGCVCHPEHNLHNASLDNFLHVEQIESEREMASQNREICRLAQVERALSNVPRVCPVATKDVTIPLRTKCMGTS
jgi:hypothetical protein